MTVVIIEESPDSAQKARRPIHPLVAPVQVFLRRRGKEAEHPGCIGAILFNQIFRVHDISLRFGHLLESSDRNLSSALPTMKDLPLTLHFVRKEITIS